MLLLEHRHKRGLFSQPVLISATRVLPKTLPLCLHSFVKPDIHWGEESCVKIQQLRNSPLEMNHIIEGPHFRFNEWVNTDAAKGADLVRNLPQMGKRDP